MLNEFLKDLEENQRNNTSKAEYFKLKNGDNKIVILTEPIGYSEVYNIGIAFDDCGYGKYASRRYKCYIKDLSDNQIKMANFSYTVAKKIAALSQGARTMFEGFPMPYVVNLKSDKAGTKEVETDVIADEDYTVNDEDMEKLSSFENIKDIIESLKTYQKKRIETDSNFKAKVEEFIQKKELENNFKNSNQQQEVEEIRLEDIPF